MGGGGQGAGHGPQLAPRGPLSFFPCLLSLLVSTSHTYVWTPQLACPSSVHPSLVRLECTAQPHFWKEALLPLDAAGRCQPFGGLLGLKETALPKVTSGASTQSVQGHKNLVPCYSSTGLHGSSVPMGWAEAFVGCTVQHPQCCPFPVLPQALS